MNQLKANQQLIIDNKSLINDYEAKLKKYKRR